MKRDPIPPKDADFDHWVVAFAAYIAANGTTMGIKAPVMSALASGVTAWTHAYAATTNPATVTSTAVSVKNEARATLETLLRPLLRQIQADPATTNDMRTSMGLHIPSRTHTRAAVPTTAPQLSLTNGQHLTHIIGIQDTAATNTTAKPPGVKACKLYHKVGGPPPKDLTEMTLLDTPGKSPYLAQFAGAQAGQVVYYQGYWTNTHDETGPLSDLVSGTLIG
jgi:hypothetical protein